MQKVLRWIALSIIAAVASPAIAMTPTPILPDDLKWAGPPQIPALKAAWVLGKETAAETYALRVRLQRKRWI